MQQLQEDGSAYVGQAEATVQSLIEEVSQLRAEQARQASVNELSRIARETAIMREAQQHQMVATLRTELGESMTSAVAAHDQVRLIVAERDQVQADLQFSKAT